MGKLSIKTFKKRFPTAKNLYGLFFEDINRAADGGLYPEMLRNRSFEDSIPPERCTTDDELSAFCTPRGWRDQFNHGEGLSRWIRDDNIPFTPIPAWYAENAELSLDLADTLGPNRKSALRADLSTGGKIYNIGFAGVPCKSGETYLLYFFAKSLSGPVTITVGFESADGKTYCCEQLRITGDEYLRYDTKLTSDAEDFNARFFIACADGGTLKLGFISLMPAETFKGHGLRSDLMAMLQDMRPTFLRFPGGCIVEGYTYETAMRFSDTIGPVWERPSLHLMWHYRTSNGLGFHEYLQLCEDLEIEPMYVINCGLTCQGRAPEFFEGEALEALLREAIDAIEYALSPADTKWGSLRAAMGHPEPFKMTYIEIGNENFGEAYLTRYKLFYDELKSRYPELRLISNIHTERYGLKTEIVDEHYYNTAEFFAQSTHLYDNYDRSGPEIFVGEYAVTYGAAGLLHAAVGEAMFMTGMENNQDIVTLAAYAPLFEHTHYMSWYPNLIRFDNHICFGIPTYHVWKLFGQNRGDYVVGLEQETDRIAERFHGLPAVICDKGTRFRNPILNGSPVSLSRAISGALSEKSGDYIISDDPPVYPLTTSSWPQAERMKNAGFFVFGEDEDAVSGQFEVEVFAEEGKEIGLGICCSRSPRRVFVEDETAKIDDWQIIYISYFRWRISGDTGTLSHVRMFRTETLLSQTEGINLNYGEYNKLRYVVSPDSVMLYVNDKLVQQSALPSCPVISASAADTADTVIIKIANIGRTIEPVEINLDCEVESVYSVELLTGDPADTNTPDNPDKIVIAERVLSGASQRFIYEAPPCSVNVIKLTKK